MLYITLHDEQDKQKFSMRMDSLRNQTSIIDENMKNPEARKLLDEIVSKTDELQFIGESLINAHDSEINVTGDFRPENHAELIRNLNKAASEIRENGVKLAELETRLKTEQEEISKKNASFLYNIISVISVIAIFIALILGYVIAKSIANPIMKLKKITIDISRGNFNTKINIKSKDEIGDLATSFNTMITNLKESKSKLEEKTKELEESKKNVGIKIDELEKFSKLSVGRELKMVELKKRIEELEDKLNNMKKRKVTDVK
jgi:nitrogen fixation/metabolism regulation signal transduction histidine kinase